MRKLDPKKTGKISVTAFIDFNKEEIVWHDCKGKSIFLLVILTYRCYFLYLLVCQQSTPYPQRWSCFLEKMLHVSSFLLLEKYETMLFLTFCVLFRFSKGYVLGFNLEEIVDDFLGLFPCGLFIISDSDGHLSFKLLLAFEIFNLWALNFMLFKFIRNPLAEIISFLEIKNIGQRICTFLSQLIPVSKRFFLPSIHPGCSWLSWLDRFALKGINTAVVFEEEGRNNLFRLEFVFLVPVRDEIDASSAQLAIEGGFGAGDIYFLGEAFGEWFGFVVVFRLLGEFDGWEFGGGPGRKELLFAFESEGKPESVISFSHYYWM